MRAAINWKDNVIKLNLDSFQELAEKKKIIDARVDEALLTLYEGSDRYKLKQISKYIVNRITYTSKYNDTIEALNGKGVCSTYAMLFYKMASRIGIKTYICYGYANEYHAWNVVELNGEYKFYDLTFYDKLIYDNVYINSEGSWGRKYQINNIWSGDLKRS